MSRIHDPPHPGEIIREQCLEPLGLSVAKAAAGLGVSRKTLSERLNGHAGISPEMAIRLEKAFGSTAETWLRMQLAYDLWQAEQCAGDIKVTRFAAPAPC
jgi:addiction module HigA family antidote